MWGEGEISDKFPRDAELGWQRIVGLKFVFKKPSTDPSTTFSTDFLHMWSVFPCLSLAKSVLSAYLSFWNKGFNSHVWDESPIRQKPADFLTSSLACKYFPSSMSTKSFGSNFPWLCLTLFLLTTFISFERFVYCLDILNFIFRLIT